jgi:hypothetical protein
MHYERQVAAGLVAERLSDVLAQAARKHS